MSKKLSVLAVIALSLMLGMSNACAEKAAKPAEEADTYELLNLFGEVMERAKTSYVEEVDDKKLIESAINGMLVSLDPHSSYLDAESYRIYERADQRQIRRFGNRSNHGKRRG